MLKRIKVFIFFILTAFACGGIFAFSGIILFAERLPKDFQNSETAVLEEGEEDPSFISRFSRVSIYSADSGREVIESAKDSLPRSLPPSQAIKITSKAYLISDLDRDVVVLEKNADRAMPIASLSKLVTAVLVKKMLDKNEYVVIEPRPLLAYGNEARFREGEELRVGELLYPLLMVSSNDAAEVLAQKYGRKEFINEMNNWVNSIGAYHTYFVDPSGISPLDVSTVKDMAIISQWILKNDPDIFEITMQKSKTIRTHTWTNPTHLLNLDAYVGGKNGYTPEAGRTSISLFKLGKQKRLFSVILLGSSSRDNDILNLLDEAVR